MTIFHKQLLTLGCLLLPLYAAAQMPPPVEGEKPPQATSVPQLTCGGFSPTVPKESIDFGPYIVKLQKKIFSNWKPIMSGLNIESKPDLPVILEFRIDCLGQLSALRLIKSCGNEKVNEAALETIKQSAPF